MTPLGTAWFVFCRRIAQLIFFDFSGGVKCIGKENIPMSGPLIVAPVHVSYLDSVAISFAVKRPTQPMAKKELFKGIFGWFITTLGAFPVNRGEADPDAIKTAIAKLGRGEVLLIFPEGTRGDGKTMLPINKGVALLAKKSGAQVLPIGIGGTVERMPMGSSKIKPGTVTVVYGRPFRYEDVATGASEKENREIFTRYLGDRIAELCNQAGMPIKTLASSSKTLESPVLAPKA